MLILEDFSINDISLKVVRDDIFPGIGGGNKSRKAVEYERDIERVGANALVTTGGIQSNHCRAIALLAARKGWRCHIVYHGFQERYEQERGNALLVKMSGASVEFVAANQISESMECAMKRFKDQGFTPYYVTGGGHDLPGGIAYVKAMEELGQKCIALDWKPNYIFLASGTGSTQSGILVGALKNGWNETRVVGISVARRQERGIEVIDAFNRKLTDYYMMKPVACDKIIFIDEYLCGGYELFTTDMRSYLAEIACEKGLLLDTTYSGKAFWGMMNYIRIHRLKGNILFWHTGGLMNLQK